MAFPCLALDLYMRVLSMEGCSNDGEVHIYLAWPDRGWILLMFIHSSHLHLASHIEHKKR